MSKIKGNDFEMSRTKENNLEWMDMKELVSKIFIYIKNFTIKVIFFIFTFSPLFFSILILQFLHKFLRHCWGHKICQHTIDSNTTRTKMKFDINSIFVFCPFVSGMKEFVLATPTKTEDKDGLPFEQFPNLLFLIFIQLFLRHNHSTAKFIRLLFICNRGNIVFLDIHYFIGFNNSCRWNFGDFFLRVHFLVKLEEWIWEMIGNEFLKEIVIYLY